MKKTSMLVDDEEEIVDFLEVYLLNDGYEIIKFSNGRDVLDFLETKEPDLAVLDVMMPDIDGFELCKKMLMRQRKSQHPIQNSL